MLEAAENGILECTGQRGRFREERLWPEGASLHRGEEPGLRAGPRGGEARVPRGGGPAHRPGARAVGCLLVECSHGRPVGLVLVLLFLSFPGQVGHAVVVHLRGVEHPALSIGFPFGRRRARVFPLVRVPGIVRVPGAGHVSRVPGLSLIPALSDLPPRAVRRGVRILRLGCTPGRGLQLGFRGHGRP